jgi:hypothetical protein
VKFIVSLSPGIGKSLLKGDLNMDYDTWKLRSPEDDYIMRNNIVKVCECEQCGEDLFSGDEVVEGFEDDKKFCNKECYIEYIEDNFLVHEILETPEQEFPDRREEM